MVSSTVFDGLLKSDIWCAGEFAVETLLGDPTKVKQKLGWVREITVLEMCIEMVASDLAEAKRHAALRSHGYCVSVSAEKK